MYEIMIYIVVENWNILKIQECIVNKNILKTCLCFLKHKVDCYL